MLDFSQKTVLITGAAGGIGSETAELLSRLGANVFATDLETHPIAEKEPYSRSHSGFIKSLVLDVTDQDSVNTCFDAILDQVEHIDVLVNCAGIREIVPTVDMPLETWRDVLDVNLTGVFLVSQRFARAAIDTQREAAIVNISSTAGRFGLQKRAAYVTSKHAVVGLTRQMAIEFASHGIRVNAVAPGVIRTNMTEAYFDDEAMMERVRRNHPFGPGHGYPSDPAAAIAFLSSEDAGFITGSILPIDGGFDAGKEF